MNGATDTTAKNLIAEPKHSVRATLKILTLMQLGDKLDVSILGDKKRFWLKMLFRVIITACVTAAVWGTLYIVGAGLLQVDITPDMLVFVLMLLQIMGIIACTMGLLKTLYQSKDNVLLLSYPATHSEVFMSKLIVYYVLEFLRTLSFLFPFLLGYGIYTFSALHWTYFINASVLTVVLPLICVLIGALLSYPVMFVADFLRGKPIISLALLLGIVGGFLYLIITFLNGLPAEESYLLNYYKAALETFAGIMRQINTFGLYLLFAKGILTMNSWQDVGRVFANYGYLLAVIIALVGLIILLAMPFYFKVASRAVELANIKHVTKLKSRKTTFGTFLAKEFKLATRDSATMFSNFSYLLIMPFILFIVNKIFGLVKANPSGDKAFLIVNVLLCLIMAMISNTSSATAISSEGSEFYLLKAAPSNTRQIAWAKVAVNLIFSTISITAAVVCISLSTEYTAIQLILIFYTLMVVNASHVLWSFEFDLLKPQVKEFIATGTAQDSTNANKSIALGIAMAFVAAGLLGLMFFDDQPGIDTVKVAWIKFLCVITVFLASRIHLFIAKLTVYFDDIEA